MIGCGCGCDRDGLIRVIAGMQRKMAGTSEIRNQMQPNATSKITVSNRSGPLNSDWFPHIILCYL